MICLVRNGFKYQYGPYYMDFFWISYRPCRGGGLNKEILGSQDFAKIPPKRSKGVKKNGSIINSHNLLFVCAISANWVLLGSVATTQLPPHVKLNFKKLCSALLCEANHQNFCSQLLRCRQQAGERPWDEIIMLQLRPKPMPPPPVLMMMPRW